MIRHTILLGCCLMLTPVVQAGELPRDSEWTNSIGMKLVRIEPGRFVMGSGAAPPGSRQQWERREWDESPAHEVTITRPFFIGVHEVTNAQYEQFDPKHEQWRGKAGNSEDDDAPVAHVTWQQAVDFCGWLSRKESRPYRLPTEAEWEYACRAGTTTPYYAGETLTAAKANFGLSSEGKPIRQAVPVGSYPPNPWGLYDMIGNVAEWCLDWYGPYEANDQVDPVGRIDGYARVTRGWSFLLASSKALRLCRSANRSGQLPEDASPCTGFRVVLGEMPATKPLPAAPLPLNQKDVAQTTPAARAPDPTEPYFVNFSRDRKTPSIAPDTWGPIFSQWNHFTTVCVCPNGDVLAAWYTTVSESGRELNQAASRLRAGADRWEPASLFFGVPDVNDHAPVLLRDGKRIYHFSTQSLRGWDYSSNVVRYSDDSGATWSKPRIMVPRDDPDHLSQPCSALVGPEGELVLACDGDSHRSERLIISRDKGKTWKVAEGNIWETAGRYAIHPAIVPVDGGILAFMRGPKPMPAFLTDDLGDSWTEVPTPLPGISVGNKTAAMKLASGGLLVCSHDSEKRLVGGGIFAALSFDNGKTWPHVRKVEGPGGYMSVAQAENGVIYLVGSRLTAAAFNEAWLKQGKPLP